MMGASGWCRAVFVVTVLLAVQGVVGLPQQLSDDSGCLADGINDTAQYRQAVLLHNRTKHFLPVFSNVNLSRHLKVDSLLIIVHGAGGKANTYFCNAVAGVSSIKSIGVVAPYFGNETVMLQDWIASSAAGNFSAVGNRTSLFWNGTTFNAGAGTANAKNVSSFDALDALLAHVIRRKGRRLKQVVLAGFSAGGQTVQRYAWASSYGSPADASNSSSVTVKFAISDPGTYLYYDTQRPKQSCRPNRDTGPSWSCSDFGSYTGTACPTFNTWKTGLDGLTPDVFPYYSRLAQSPANLSAAYLNKDIIYVFGEADTCNCQTSGFTNAAVCIRQNDTCSPSKGGDSTCCDMPPPFTQNAFVDTSCGDMLQGSNRLQRGLLFMSYLKTFSGGSFTPRFTTVPNMGHDDALMYTSATFLSFLSATNSSANSSTTTG